VSEVPVYLDDEYDTCTVHVPAVSCERGSDSPSAQSIDVAERAAEPDADRLWPPSVAVSVQVPPVSTTPVTPAAAVMAPAASVPHLVRIRVACSRPSAAGAVGVGTGGSVAAPSPGSLPSGVAAAAVLLGAVRVGVGVARAVAVAEVRADEPVAEAEAPTGSMRPAAMSHHSAPPAASSTAAAATPIRTRRERNTFQL
jgi:hypothetical protein